MHGPRPPRSTPPNALSPEEKDKVLRLLRSPAYRNLAVTQVWAMLLDEGRYLCSQSTMHRLLRQAGENRDRRRQRTHPSKTKPHLMAREPLAVWSWDIERHEALSNRAVMKGHRRRLVAASRLKLRAA